MAGVLARVIVVLGRPHTGLVTLPAWAKGGSGRGAPRSHLFAPWDQMVCKASCGRSGEGVCLPGARHLLELLTALRAGRCRCDRAHQDVSPGTVKSPVKVTRPASAG